MVHNARYPELSTASRGFSPGRPFDAAQGRPFDAAQGGPFGSAQGGLISVRHGERRAFTLIELLVVIAILGVLASLITPMATRAIEKGKATACRNNLRQINTTALLMAQEGVFGVDPGFIPPHRGLNMTIPGQSQKWEFTWFGLFAQEMGLAHFEPLENAIHLTESKPPVFMCPSGDRSIVGWEIKNLSYGYSRTAAQEMYDRKIVLKDHYRLSDSTPPSKKGLFADSDQNEEEDDSIRLNNSYPDHYKGNPAWPPGDRHSRGGNVAYADGHVTWLPIEELATVGVAFP